MVKRKKSKILTPKELKVIRKKLSRVKLTQQDSNYLSKFVRPKLKEIKTINAGHLLDMLDYNQKAISIERVIKRIILESLNNVDSINLYGSAIQNNYKDYNDVDVLVIVKKKYWRTLSEKYKKILDIKSQAKEHSINLDIEVYDKKTFQKSYSSNISLIYQLKNRKTIYGKLRLKRKLEIPKLDLRIKVDYSVLDKNPDTIEIYKAIRNLILVNLVLKKIIDNQELNHKMQEEIGKYLAERLRKGGVSKTEYKIALLHLNRLLELTLKKLKEAKWEKIVLLNH